MYHRNLLSAYGRTTDWHKPTFLEIGTEKVECCGPHRPRCRSAWSQVEKGPLIKWASGIPMFLRCLITKVRAKGKASSFSHHPWACYMHMHPSGLVPFISLPKAPAFFLVSIWQASTAFWLPDSSLGARSSSRRQRAVRGHTQKIESQPLFIKKEREVVNLFQRLFIAPPTNRSILSRVCFGRGPSENKSPRWNQIRPHQSWELLTG